MEDKPLTFTHCLMECAANKELVREFDRITGHNLSRKGAPIELMVDDATGRTDAGAAAFAEFVHDTVWSRLPSPAPVPGSGEEVTEK